MLGFRWVELGSGPLEIAPRHTALPGLKVGAAFANAFAYAAQIEVAITVALVWAFRKAGVVNMVDGDIKVKVVDGEMRVVVEDKGQGGTVETTSTKDTEAV